MSRWATVDRDRLVHLRNEKSAEFRAIADIRKSTVSQSDAVGAAALLGCIQALDILLEVTKPRSGE